MFHAALENYLYRAPLFFFFLFFFPNEPTIKASLLGKPQIVCPQLLYYLNSSKLVLQLILISFWGRILREDCKKEFLKSGAQGITLP